MVLFELEVVWDQAWSYVYYMTVNLTTGFHLTPDNNFPTTRLRVIIKYVSRHCLPVEKNHLQVTTTNLYENLKKKGKTGL